MDVPNTSIYPTPEYVTNVIERRLSASEEGEAGHYRYDRQV